MGIRSQEAIKGDERHAWNVYKETFLQCCCTEHAIRSQCLVYPASKKTGHKDSKRNGSGNMKNGEHTEKSSSTSNQGIENNPL